ncbi:unnamed protein product, partial [Discosporangium mesarthrocarpum]
MGVGGRGRGIEDETSLANGSIVTMQDSDRRELEAELRERLGGRGHLLQAADAYRDLVKTFPDQWSGYVKLFNVTARIHGLGQMGGADLKMLD